MKIIFDTLTFLAGDATTTKRGDRGDQENQAGRHAPEAAQRPADRGHDGRGGGTGESVRRQPGYHCGAGHVARASYPASRRSGHQLLNLKDRYIFNFKEFCVAELSIFYEFIIKYR